MPPSPPKPLSRFTLQVLGLVAILALWPGPREAYVPLFHAGANAAFRSFGAHRAVVFEGAESGAPDAPGDTRMIGVDYRFGRPLWRAWFSARRIGYWPSVALVALVLATPLPWRRRGLALLAGVALVQLFALLRAGVLALSLFRQVEAGADAEPGWLDEALRVGTESFDATIPSLAAVVAIWALVARPSRVLALPAALRRSS